MTERLDPFSVRSEAMRSLVIFEASVLGEGVERSVLRLAKLRVSQMLGSVFCIDRYRREAHVNGETAARLETLETWRTAGDGFSRRERAALAWAEVVVRPTESVISDDAYDAASSIFQAEELLALTAAISAATAWNQICLSFRIEPVSCEATLVSKTRTTDS